jgi:hypothetical protein
MLSDFDNNDDGPPDEDVREQANQKMAEILQTLEYSHKWLHNAPDFGKLAECFTIATIAWREKNEGKGVKDEELRRILSWLHSWYVDCVMVGMVLTGQTGIAYPEESDEPMFAKPKFEDDEEDDNDSEPDDAT